MDKKTTELSKIIYLVDEKRKANISGAHIWGLPFDEISNSEKLSYYVRAEEFLEIIDFLKALRKAKKLKKRTGKNESKNTGVFNQA